MRQLRENLLANTISFASHLRKDRRDERFTHLMGGTSPGERARLTCGMEIAEIIITRRDQDGRPTSNNDREFSPDEAYTYQRC